MPFSLFRASGRLLALGLALGLALAVGLRLRFALGLGLAGRQEVTDFTTFSGKSSCEGAMTSRFLDVSLAAILKKGRGGGITGPCNTTVCKRIPANLMLG